MDWTVEGQGNDEFAIVDDCDVVVATVPWEIETGVDPTDTAEYRRAQLIAAAPELLAALEGLVNGIQTDTCALHCKGDYAIAQEFRVALEAIAKAKGGPQ